MKAACVIAVTVFFVIGLWLIAIPEKKLASLIEGSINHPAFSVSTEGFRKGLFYNFSSDKIIIKQRDAEVPGSILLTCEGLEGRLNLRSLLKLGPRMDFTCMAGSGRIKGWVKVFESGTLTINGSGVHINEIPLFESLGISGDGTLSLVLQVIRGSGELIFSVDDAKLSSAIMPEVFLPLEMFKNIKGAITITRDKADIRSFTLEGKGLYARLKGNITGNNLDASMELMMDPSLETGPRYRTLLVQYLVSPGYYVMPVRKSLLFKGA